MENNILRDILVNFVIVYFVKGTANECDPGWLPYYRDKACFKLFDTRKLRWEDAKRFCNRHGAYLSDMADYTEQKFINDSIVGSRNINHGVWLGASDKEESVWRWVNNTRMNIDLYLWRTGNPDNGKVILNIGGVEDCLEMTTEPGYRGTLNDYHCRKGLAFVCKSKKMFTETTTSYPLTNSTTTEMHREQRHPEPPGRETTTVLVISLVSGFVVSCVVIIVVLVIYRKRKRKNSRNVYADTTEIFPNEHIYAGLGNSTQNTHNDDNSVHIYTYEQPSCRVEKSGSTDELLQCGETNVYERLGDSLYSSGNIGYQATGSENACTAEGVKGKCEATHQKQNTGKLGPPNQTNATERFNSGYLDMSVGDYVEFPVAKNQQNDLRASGNDYYVAPLDVNANRHAAKNGEKSSHGNGMSNTGNSDGYVDPKAKFAVAVPKRKTGGLIQNTNKISGYYLTPVGGDKEA